MYYENKEHNSYLGFVCIVHNTIAGLEWVNFVISTHSDIDDSFLQIDKWIARFFADALGTCTPLQYANFFHRAHNAIGLTGVDTSMGNVCDMQHDCVTVDVELRLVSMLSV